MNKITKSIKYADQTITLETGFLARQADGAVFARAGDTVVLATVVVGDIKEDTDFFPLTVEYEERLYAGGIIKGSKWAKREGRPSDQAILNGRVIDRSIRPLFPKDFRNEIQVIVTVMSVDDENDPVVLGVSAVSAALRMTGLPWNGPIAAMRVAMLEGKAVLNPAVKLMNGSDMDLLVSASREQILMVEMGGNQIPQAQVLESINMAYESLQDVVAGIEEFAIEAQKTLGIPFQPPVVELTDEQTKEQEVLKQVAQYIKDNFPEALFSPRIEDRKKAEEDFKLTLFAEYEGKTTKAKMAEQYEKVARLKMREKVVTSKTRADGRKLDEVRPITIQVGVLPRTHGSAVFQRGDTQALSVATLGSSSLEQLVEGMLGEESRRYFHHYNFPPFSTGETGRVGTPKRREIGHGALAERAIMGILPDKADFPYTIRVVSEILSSNGSTSMASVCGSTLSLMDAGVPIKEPVSGIAMGLIKEGEEVIILSDIMGMEDFYGDMDFKVAGTKNGITALQMDIKISGLTKEILEKAIMQAETGRMHILSLMLKEISEPRQTLSQYAPKIQSIKINPKKIGEVIGTGGKVIRAIQEETGTEIDIEEDGTVHVAGIDAEGLARAVEQITLLTKELEVGEIYMGRVTRILDFGAFVEVLPGKEGLVHVSELANSYVKNVRDVVDEGDTFEVKVIGIDDQGRVNLSRKALLAGEQHDQQVMYDSAERRDNRRPDHRRRN
jgi:polyribonucleotide nucleotidyltransferase